MRNTRRNIELTRPPAILIALNATTTTAGALVQIYIMDIIDTADSTTSPPASRYGYRRRIFHFFIIIIIIK